MERKGLVIVVILLLSGFIFLWNHNSSADKTLAPTDSKSATTAKKVSHSGHGNLRWRNQSVVDLTAKSSVKDVFSVQVSAEGAALKSVRLHDEQYRHKKRTENAPAFLPKALVEAGDYEVVNVHKVSQYPFRFIVEKPDSSKNLPEVIRVVRKAARVEPVSGQPNQLRFSDSMNLDDLYLRKGDLVQINGAEISVSSVVNTEKMSSGTARTEVRQIVALSQPVPTPLPATVDAIRKGDIYTQYEADMRYVCVDCVAVDGSPGMYHPNNANGKATFVWPNPKRDESDIWIERTWMAVSDYRLQHTSRIINLGSYKCRVGSIRVRWM